MPSIAFFTAHRTFPWQRQLRPDHHTEDGFRVTIDREDEDCRLLVVYDEPPQGLSTQMPIENRLLVVSEPPGIKRYHARYTEQFGTVMGPIRPESPATRWMEGQPALPWFYGIGFTPQGLVINRAFDEIAETPPPAKMPDISVVVSLKSQLPKHRARLAFVERLKSRLGDRLHVFGRGFEEISDKAEAIDPFAYHLVLENNDIPHFFTEKTADALLGWALPIFSGCANIGDYLPQGSYVPIDIERPDEAISRIIAVIESGVHSSRIDAIRDARNQLLGPLNLQTRLSALAARTPAANLIPPKRIRSTTDFSLFHRIRKAIRRKKA